MTADAERPDWLLPPATPTVALGPVFVIDDDTVARSVVVKFLRELPLANPVVTCADGEEAVARLAEYTEPSSPLPVLVITDRQMPMRSGLEVVRWMRAQPRLRLVPVVMLSGSSDVAGIHEGYALGVEAYLVKPVGFGALDDVLRSLPVPWAIVSSEVSR
ncbi:MAG: response regulator [Actinobacteria bacterium]|nr:response regulator [Actinomycetota bacterium]